MEDTLMEVIGRLAGGKGGWGGGGALSTVTRDRQGGRSENLENGCVHIRSGGGGGGLVLLATRKNISLKKSRMTVYFSEF